MILLHTVNPEDPPQIVNSNKLNKVAGHRSNTQNRLCLYSNTKQLEKKAKKKGASLVVQWLRICFEMQGTVV